MASHLTVTTSTAGVSSTRAFGSSPAESAGEDVFAALLGAQNSEPAATNSTKATNPSTSPNADGQSKPEDPEAIAAAIDAAIPIISAEAAKPQLNELIEGLADLKARLAAGQPLDGEELKRLDALLSNLAQQLNIDLSDMPTPEEMAALLAGTGAAEDSFANTLTEAFGPLVGALLGNTDTDVTAELATQIKAVGDKLAAILSALNQGEADADQLAGMEQNAVSDTDLKAALDRLLKPAIAADAAPVLATPKLDITETALTGKTNLDVAAAPKSDTADTTLLAQPPGKDNEQPSDRDAEQRPDDRKPVEAKPADAKPVATATTAAAAAADKQADTAVNVQQVPAARVDAVAATRVVQAGYQTSQQQLNLPQLAFEMARQVTDGNTRFQIRLDPAELGRIDVRLDIDASGQVNARLTVEKAETLDLMQRDQKGLERALQQAGLDASKTNLEFSLKQNPFSGGQQGQNGNDRNSLFGADAAEADEVPLPTINLYRGSLSASGVNIIA